MLKQHSDQTTGWVFVFPALAFVAVFALYPAIESFVLSLHRIYLGLPSLGQPYVGFDNYVQLAQDPVARQAYLVTFGFVFLSTIFE